MQNMQQQRMIVDFEGNVDSCPACSNVAELEYQLKKASDEGENQKWKNLNGHLSALCGSQKCTATLQRQRLPMNCA